MEEHNDHVIFICECNSIEHQLVFTYDKDWEEVFASVHLVPFNIWKRIWIAIKYIFGYKTPAFDEFIFKKSDSDKLQKIVNYLCV